MQITTKFDIGQRVRFNRGDLGAVVSVEAWAKSRRTLVAYKIKRHDSELCLILSEAELEAVE